ncbi:MAG: hydrogenase maturation protease [Burkholderiales bacterium]|nr:hydrogenase maturation protease [Burkholderiales bacterium]
MLDIRSVLVLGIGNRLLGDDGAGPQAIDLLAARRCGATLQDGGTIGLHLLPAIQDAAALIAVDAAMFGAEPGAVRVFEGVAMDRQLGGRKKTAHEVALADLLGAAALSATLPRRRALVAVQPQACDWGLEPSEPVRAALPALCDRVQELLQRWQGAGAA